MPGVYDLTLRCARLFTIQKAIYYNHQVLRLCRIPDNFRIDHLYRNKRLLHTSETTSQQSAELTTVSDSSQTSSSGSPQSGSRVGDEQRQIELYIRGAKQVFDSLRLRDMCQCERCIDRSTTQKLFDTLDIPTDIRGRDPEVYSDGSFSISWTSDVPGYVDHRSCYRGPLSHLSTIRNVDAMMKQVLRRAHPRIFWDQQMLEHRQLQMNVTYNEYMTDEKVYRSVIQELFQYGIVFVKNVPNTSESVAEIGKRMGGVRTTIYGPTWDVRAVPSAKNIASKSSELGFHMDLLYYNEPPKLQILHCLKQSDQGGESLFTDSFRAVWNLFRQHFPTLETRTSTMNVLMTFKIPFHYKNNGYWLRCPHSTLAVNRDWLDHNKHIGADELLDRLQAVRWSPPFQAPIGKFYSASKPGLDLWIRAARLLREEFRRQSSIYQTKLEEGTCVIFDNSRVLHARNAFSGDQRWFRGAYIDEATFTQQVLRLDSTWRRDTLS